MDRIGVLFLTNWLPVGGFETHLLSITKRLDRDSFHPVLCCLKAGGPLEEEFRAMGMPVYTRIQSHRFDPRGVWRLARIMKQEGIQLLDTDLQRNTVFLGTIAARLARVPAAVISVHVVAHMERPRIVEWPARISIGRIDRVIALFNAHRDQLVHDEGVDPARIVILWNGVDVEQFRPRPPRENLREELRIPKGAPVVAIVASLLALKAHESFLRAAARVLDRHPHTQFLIVGEGPEREKLERMAQQMGLDSAVHFLGRRRDLADLFTIVDINVLSSLWEAAPISTLEAMACAIPTVSTRVGALPEMIVHQETGFVVDVGEDEALAGAITRLLDDPDLREKMGSAARHRVESLFDIQKTVRERENLYRDLLNKKLGAGRMP